MKRLILIPLLAVTVAFSGCEVTKFATTGVNLSTSGATGIVTDDRIVVQTERALNAALDTFDLFLKTERDYETELKQVSPQIHVYAEKVRANGKNWIKSAQATKNAYKANRTSQNYANLVTAYKTLNEAVAQSKQYTQQAATVKL